MSSQSDAQILHTEQWQVSHFFWDLCSTKPCSGGEVDRSDPGIWQLWHDARKMWPTASTAKRIPKRSSTNLQNFLTERLHTTFTDKSAIKYGGRKKEETTWIMEAQGHNAERRGPVVCPHHPWLGAGPNGILDSAELFEIKCPLKSAMSTCRVSWSAIWWHQMLAWWEVSHSSQQAKRILLQVSEKYHLILVRMCEVMWQILVNLC